MSGRVVVAILGMTGVGLLVAGLLLLREPAHVSAKTLPVAALLDASGGAPPKNGQLAPEFELREANGTVQRLSDFRGRPVLINFFATWCAPCRTETPGLQQSYEKLKDRGFVILSIDVDARESNGKVAAFVDKYGLTFPVALDQSAAVSRRYGVYGIPANFFVDKAGYVRFFSNSVTPEIIEQWLQSLW